MKFCQLTSLLTYSAALLLFTAPWVTSVLAATSDEVCGNSILDGGEQCDDGNSDAGDGCSASCQVEEDWSCTLPQPPVAGTNALPEGGFESGAPNDVWAEASTNFETLLCSDATCCEDGMCDTSVGPNSGIWYVWFGGINAVEVGSVQQDFMIEATDTELTFARKLQACYSADDFVKLTLDETTVWEKDGADPACGELDYFTETIDLVSAPGGPYNNGLAHTIKFDSSIIAANINTEPSNFFIDDVSILRGGTPAQPSVCTSSFTIGGTVNGLTGSGLVLQNNAEDDLPIEADVSFTFATPLVDGSDYLVTVLTHPGEPVQDCEVINGNGTLTGTEVTNVIVTCSTVKPEIIFIDGFENQQD